MIIPNGQMIGRVGIGGVDLALDTVTASAVIRFGRVDPGDPPIASTLQLVLIDLEASSRIETGDLIELDLIDAEPRFRGQITDLSQSWDPSAALTIVAAGNLARVARRKVGNADWPQETFSARVARVLADADWTDYTIEYGRNPLVAARTASETTAGAELANLAVTGAAAIIDLPDGSLLIQTIDARALLAAPILELPPELVLFAPDWSQSLDVLNVIDVAYGTLEDPHTQTSRNVDSVTRFGERGGSLASTFALEADAATAGAAMVARRGYPHWIAPTVQLSGLVTPRIGALAKLTELPDGSPLGAIWQPVVEGWQDTLDGDEWLTMLQVSDPIRSGVSLRWIDVPPALTWATVDPDCQWTDASVLGALIDTPARTEVAA